MQARLRWRLGGGWLVLSAVGCRWCPSRAVFIARLARSFLFCPPALSVHSRAPWSLLHTALPLGRSMKLSSPGCVFVFLGSL